MTLNDRYALQQKSSPGETERFMPMNAVGSGTYSLIAPPKELLQMYGHYLYGNRSDANLITLYHSIPEIYSPIDAIARRVVSADIQLKRIKDDEVVYDYKPWNDLYTAPNCMQTFKEWLYEAVTYKYVIGKNYAYRNVPETLKAKFENIVALWNLPGDRVLPVYNYAVKLFQAVKISDVISKYELFDGINTGEYTTDSILHSKSINLDWVDRRLRGKSPLLAADIALCNLIAVYEARNVIYTKRGALGAIVSKKEDESGPVAMGSGDKKKVRDAFNEEYGVTGRRDLFPISEVPIEFVQFGMSIQELMPFEEATACMAAVYSVLNVPFDLAPNPKGSTFSNQAGSMRSIYTNVAIPEANTWMEGTTRFLGLDKIGYYLFADFSKIHELQENKKEQAQVESSNSVTYKNLFLNGIITLNQWAIKSGFDQSTNPLYDIKIYDMSPEQLVQITTIIKLNTTMPAPATGNVGTTNPLDTEDQSDDK